MERLLMTIADDPSQIITHKTVRSAMDRLDTNKDKRITFDEFIRVSPGLLDTAACCMVSTTTQCRWISLQAATQDLLDLCGKLAICLCNIAAMQAVMPDVWAISR